MLEDVYKAYARKAGEIDWKKYNQNELFRKYIEHEQGELAEAFFAGIVCRYWGYAGRVFVQCNRHIPFEECLDCIIDAIRYVVKKRVWEDFNSTLYNDPTGPDKAMHIAMKRQRSIMLSKYNAKRRLSNFNTLSIDEAHESFNDSADGLLFDLQNTTDQLRTFISEYFEKEEYLNGLILDYICYSNEKYSDKNVIKYLKSFNAKDAEYLKHNYEIDENILKKTIFEVKQMSSEYLRIKINSLLYSIKNGGLFND